MPRFMKILEKHESAHIVKVELSLACHSFMVLVQHMNDLYSLKNVYFHFE